MVGRGRHCANAYSESSRPNKRDYCFGGPVLSYSPVLNLNLSNVSAMVIRVKKELSLIAAIGGAAATPPWGKKQVLRWDVPFSTTSIEA